MDSVNLDWVTNFVLDIADDVLRDLVRGENRDVILPIMVLRRLDAVLEATKIQRPFVWEPVKVRNLLGLFVSGLSCRISDRVAQPDCASQGRDLVRWQTYPHRRPARH
jgi:hypothetical protein